MPTRTNTSPADSEEAPVQISSNQVKKIAIIGGGASGAIVLDSLVKEGHVAEIVLFERRDTVGGIWVFDDKSALSHVPQIRAGASRAELDPPLTNPFVDPEIAEKNGSSQKIRLLASAQERFEPTPAYEQMNTNIIENMMTYSDEKHWGATPGPPFADRAQVQNYISRYIDRHRARSNVRVQMRTTVEDVARVNKINGGFSGTGNGAETQDQDQDHVEELRYGFKITLRQRLDDGTDLWWQEEFDSLVVATGHYHVPQIPAVPGIEAVQSKYPQVFEHAKFFTSGRKYKDETVVVVGSRASGTDLTRFIADHAAHVYQSVRSTENTKKFVSRTNVDLKPVIDRYVETATGFEMVFADGTVVANPDHVVYATGYQFSYPFLEREFGDITRHNGAVVPHLYQHTFLTGEPLVNIVGVPTDAISFRAFEFQAILLARFLAGKVALPSVREQKQWIQNRAKVYGDTRAFHTIGVLEARNYMAELTRLGALKNPADLSGREFPVTTEAEVEEYARAAYALRDSWN